MAVHGLRPGAHPQSQVDAWIADPKRRVEPTVWDAADGALPWGCAFLLRSDFCKSC